MTLEQQYHTLINKILNSVEESINKYCDRHSVDTVMLTDKHMIQTHVDTNGFLKDTHIVGFKRTLEDGCYDFEILKSVYHNKITKDSVVGESITDCFDYKSEFFIFQNWLSDLTKKM